MQNKKDRISARRKGEHKSVEGTEIQGKEHREQKQG